MHFAPLIQDLAVILGVAGIMSLLFQKNSTACSLPGFTGDFRAGLGFGEVKPTDFANSRGIWGRGRGNRTRGPPDDSSRSELILRTGDLLW